jgi:hypothetical protein
MKTPRSIAYGVVRVNLRTGAIWHYNDSYLFRGDDYQTPVRVSGFSGASPKALTLARFDSPEASAEEIVLLEYGPPSNIAESYNGVIPSYFVSPMIPLSSKADVKGMINRVLIHGYFPSWIDDEVPPNTWYPTLYVYGGDGETLRRTITFESDGTQMIDLHFTPVFDYYVRLAIYCYDQFMLYSPIIINPW